jgi:hypothetical protein
MVFPSVLFPWGVPNNNLYAYLFSLISATCRAHLNLFHLIIVIILDEEYKLRIPSSFTFLHPTVEIFSSAPFSQTPPVFVPPPMPETKFHYIYYTCQ